MSVKAEVEVLESGVAVVRCAGRITIGTGSGTLRNALREVLAAHHQKVVMDFAEVPYIDSSGLGELVSGYTDLVNAGGSLVLAGVAERVRQVLNHTRLSKVFRSFAGVAEAVAYLTSPR